VVANFLSHALEYLLSNALLTRFVKIRKVCCPKVLPFGVLSMLLLPVLAHLLYILSCILTDAWIIPVWADNNMSTIS
jgi:hypothetical protein